MQNVDRRTFLKGSAIFSIVGALNPRHSLSALTQWDTRCSSQLERTARGANHPFFVQAKHQPEVIAHRGGNGQWPGETMFAYKKAVELGVDIIEMDVFLTKDGHLILMHDNDVTKTTDFNADGRRAVHNFTLAELKELNAGFKWSPGGDHDRPYKNDSNRDLKVTTVQEVFHEFPEQRMNIEMKFAGSNYSPASRLAEMIHRAKMTDKVLVASMSDDYLRQFRRLAPDVATSASRSELLRFAIGKNLKDDAGPEPDALQMKDRLSIVRLLNKSFVARAHRPQVNLPVHAWTVNDINSMRRMVTIGVDGIITDYPGPLLALLNRVKRV